uniref:Centrosomal protein 192 n=1 Tax=Gasterosteus aculeatus aculeatus TaxID=481459 RepID=G3NHS0_GASAC
MLTAFLFSSGANGPHSVVYQNEEGQWVTDLAYYSSFEKELDGKTSDNVSQFKLVKDQEEFEKEHQFMQPSFGYIITSPEKREPFPLIHPSDRPALPDHSDASGSDSSPDNQSCVSPNNNSSSLMLSISTIASAIADASISTDPSQLAAMIVELTKRSRARNRPESVGPAVNSTKEPHSAEHVRLTFRFLHLQILLLFELPKGFSDPGVDATQPNFRPSTSPLTHSSPSQTSIPCADRYCITQYIICIQYINRLNVCAFCGFCFNFNQMGEIMTFMIPDQRIYTTNLSSYLQMKSLRLLGDKAPTVPLSSSGQVVVPEELRFPHACCVGIASQTSLSLFNPSERWQQVSITVTSLAIDGEKVDSLPYQWLIVKNKTIIAPKSTEEQKVLFIPPQAGVYQCVFSVCSWPASAETEVAARANIFAKRVVLFAIAENPALEVRSTESGCLDFGDLPGGSAKSLPLKLLSRTRATVPIRLVISANATAWGCFAFSTQPVSITSEAALQAGHMTPVSSPSVMNHVMHASYGENPQSFMVWVHFNAPQKYVVSSGELGPADEYSARVDIEVDSPGPSHVIRSVPLRARSGTARVHAPKDLQTVSLSAPAGKSSQQTLPLKNAGNIDVQLKLKVIAPLNKSLVWTLLCCSLLTILVLPSGPQYEVTLRGEVVPEDSGKPAIPLAAVFGPGLASDVPPILSNKQFVAWGGVTLGRAVQQKLVLRNNSSTATQQLRLLIRGQDQDCFQLQSMFSVEERLTRHGELSIRPREDVAVHLLFAPTRVACMLAKLEIKQSGVRPSQPGVKFTIPLSGYGGTSNIILEDQRKQADGYVATLNDVAAGRVSKACLCVRNTGSRAAYIKAVAFSNVQTRSVMEPSVISLAPSQFVLKERTQEVGEQLLQIKPEAVRKALSENSLLKNINFNETFLEEENVTEGYDLPQRPNEAHLFYGNMSKVVVSLMGSRKSPECEQSDLTELLPSSRLRSAAHGNLTNNNVSLDVLPVKGPQGPALRAAEPSLKVPQAPLQVQIRNNTSRELSFDLSWPAHCLTITPQHGLIEPQCHLQILISPNPSLATKSTLLPWSGQIYVQCDSQQKVWDTLGTQLFQTEAATPVLPVARLAARTSLPPQTPLAPQALVEISNKTIMFPTTPSGETSAVMSGTRTKLSPLLSPQGVDTTGDVYRATYTAFRCCRISGTLGPDEKMQVPFMFLPRDRGDYAQFWDLECHPVSEPQQKDRIRFQLCGTCGPEVGPQEGDCSLVKTEATVKTRKRADASLGKTSQEETAVRRGVYAPQDLYTFPATRTGQSSTLKVNIRNNSSDTHELKFVNPAEPFHIKHSKYSLRSQHYLKLPVQFKPSSAGRHTGLLLVQSETSGTLVIQLTAEALP